jgi:hypothetical protein
MEEESRESIKVAHFLNVALRDDPIFADVLHDFPVLHSMGISTRSRISLLLQEEKMHALSKSRGARMWRKDARHIFSSVSLCKSRV